MIEICDCHYPPHLRVPACGPITTTNEYANLAESLQDRLKEQAGVIAALRKTAVENVELRERTQKLESVLWLYVKYEEDTSQCPDCCEEGDVCIYRAAKALLEATGAPDNPPNR